ncbi:hypothetical protein D3C74_150730 [compost metagenome]
MFGAINYETGQVHHHEEEKADVKAWIRFLTAPLEAYLEGKVVIILDNARIHHAPDLQPFFAKAKPIRASIPTSIQSRSESHGRGIEGVKG